MKKLKKIILYVSGPGVILVEAVALFIHLFTANNTKPWIVGGLIVFIVVFIPFYSVEYFRQNYKDDRDKKSVRFKKKNTRTEWGGGNVHGTVPKNVERSGKLFDE